jgi:peptide chain release factor 1
MTPIPKDKLDRLVGRLDIIQAELNAGPEQQKFVALSKEFAELSPVVATINALRAAETELADTREIARSRDHELAAMAQAEIPALETHIAERCRRRKERHPRSTRWDRGRRSRPVRG